MHQVILVMNCRWKLKYKLTMQTYNKYRHKQSFNGIIIVNGFWKTALVIFCVFLWKMLSFHTYKEGKKQLII